MKINKNYQALRGRLKNIIFESQKFSSLSFKDPSFSIIHFTFFLKNCFFKKNGVNLTLLGNISMGV